MRKYTVVLSDEAMADINALFNYIANELKQKETAFRYRTKLIGKINALPTYAASVSITPNVYIQSLYGPCARRVNCGKMAIIYIIKGDFICIKRVMAASLIR
jgi:plasmid stabilization system protein ParE